MRGEGRIGRQGVLEIQGIVASYTLESLMILEAHPVVMGTIGYYNCGVARKMALTNEYLWARGDTAESRCAVWAHPTGANGPRVTTNLNAAFRLLVHEAKWEWGKGEAQ